MEKEITIKTTQAGVNLHNAYFESVETFSNHLDQLNKWHNLVKKFDLIKPTEEITKRSKFLKSLIDIDSLLCIAITDLGLISKELFIASVALQKSFYIKHAYLVIYETIYNFNSSSDKRKVLKDLTHNSVDITLSKNFMEITNALRTFNKKFGMETKIANIRNTLAGHIDRDFDKWYSTILSLDAQYTGEMVAEFLKIVIQLQYLSRTLLQIEMQELDRTNQRMSDDFDQTLSELEGLFNKVNKDIEDKNEYFDINLLKNIFRS